MSDQGDAGDAGDAGGPGRPGGDGARAGIPAQAHSSAQARSRIAAGILGPILLTTAYFTIPFDLIGPKYRGLAWLILAGLLALLAVGMMVTTNRALTDQSGRYQHPGVPFALLSWAAILVFAATYWAMAARQGQFVGLQTRLDALYFTGVTMATVGYGDIHPSGQLARGVVLIQLVYTFAFLVGGVTALRTRAQTNRVRRTGG